MDFFQNAECVFDRLVKNRALYQVYEEVQNDKVAEKREELPSETGLFAVLSLC